MKQKQWKGVLLLITLSLMTGSCNSNDENDMNSDTGRGTSSAFFPEFNFSLPASISSETKAKTLSERAMSDFANDHNTLLEGWATHMDRIIDKTNRIMMSLNGNDVMGTGMKMGNKMDKGKGSFSGKGMDMGMSGTVQELSNDPAYQYEALICENGKEFMQLKWNAEGSLVEAVRDFSHISSNMMVSATNMVVKILYQQTSSATLVEVWSHGTPWVKENVVTDGDLLTRYVYGKKTADGAIALKGVQDWYATVPATFTADGYLTGKINEDGKTGEFVGYRKFNTALCNDTFSESSPSWCLGRAIESSTAYTSAQRNEAWERLKTMGVAEQSKLASVSLSTSLICP
ncbi:hypothetical protein WDW89_23740 [Deltaproteobacteria bacterium TL4]